MSQLSVANEEEVVAHTSLNSDSENTSENVYDNEDVNDDEDVDDNEDGDDDEDSDDDSDENEENISQSNVSLLWYDMRWKFMVFSFQIQLKASNTHSKDLNPVDNQRMYEPSTSIVSTDDMKLWRGCDGVPIHAIFDWILTEIILLINFKVQRAKAEERWYEVAALGGQQWIYRKSEGKKVLATEVFFRGNLLEED